MRLRSFFFALFLILGPVSQSMGQVGLPRDDTEGQRFKIDFTGGAWFPRLEGTTTLGVNGTAIDMGELDLDQSEVAFNGEASICWDRCRVTIGGYDFSTSGSAVMNRRVDLGGVIARPGDTINSQIDAWSVSTEFAYDLITPFEEKTFPWSAPKSPVKNQLADGRQVLDFRLAVTAGARLVNLQQSYSVLGGGTVETNNAWVAPLLGGEFKLTWVTRGTVPLLDHVVARVHASGGPAFVGGSYMMSIRAGLTFYFTRNLGLTLGYRLSDWALTREDNTFDEGGLQGLFAGVSYTW